MLIGTVDYVSTRPWNDPYNPWPQYFQVSLSAADANLNASGAPLIMQLTEFDPLAVGEQQWVYESQNAEGDTVLMTYNSGSNQVTILDGNVGAYFYLSTIVRSVPAGWRQGNTNWQIAGDNGSDETTLSIIPVTTCLNPWEYRRRRMLEMC